MQFRCVMSNNEIRSKVTNCFCEGRLPGLFLQKTQNTTHCHELCLAHLLINCGQPYAELHDSAHAGCKKGTSLKMHWTELIGRYFVSCKPNQTIFVSLDVQTGGLQMSFEHQK
jgi:hypothetical protein